MPAGRSIIGRCPDCCTCPVPEVPGASIDLTFVSRTGTLGCVGTSMSGSVNYEELIYESNDDGVTAPTLSYRDTRTATASGGWNYYSGGTVSVSFTQTVEAPTSSPPVTTTTYDDEYSDCTIGIPSDPWNQIPQYSEPVEAGASHLIWEFREADLIVTTDPATGLTYSRFRQYYNPDTGGVQNVYGDASPLGSPWRLVYERKRTASGSITGRTVIGVIDDPTPGDDECAVSNNTDGGGVSITVTMAVTGMPDTTYVVTVTYIDTPLATPPVTEEFEITTDEDGLAEVDVAILQPAEGVTRCIQSVDLRPTSYIVRFWAPLTGCYSASWTITNDEGSGVTGDVWDGIVPAGYERDDPTTWPFLGPFPLEEGDELSDFVGDCSCL